MLKRFQSYIERKKLRLSVENPRLWYTRRQVAARREEKNMEIGERKDRGGESI